MERKKLSTWFWGALVGLVMVGFAAPNGVWAKTLKIGALLNFEFPLGVQCKRELDAVIPAFNKKGGLEIKGERYTIELIVYDSKFQAETARAAVERLIYRDKVKFILGDETADAWLPVTEANKVLVVCTSPSPVVRSPKYKYVFQASSLNTMSPVAWASPYEDCWVGFHRRFEGACRGRKPSPALQGVRTEDPGHNFLSS